MHALVFAGGVNADTIAIPQHDLVIAADSGYHHARNVGLTVDVLLGDFDSIDADSLTEAEQSGVTVVRFPSEKDATDLEIALDEAVSRGADEITVFAGGGGRLDHLFGNLLVISNAKYLTKTLVFIDGLTRAQAIHSRAEIKGNGKILSLFALGGAAVVSTSGLLYSLSNEVLEANSSRGVSNEITDDVATIEVSSGTVLAITTE